MFFHGAQPDPEAQADGDPGEEAMKSEGDGLHHHEIHEDEAGGFHSKHTFPDGREEHDDHADYDEAKSKMDSDFGCESGDNDGDEMDDGSTGEDSPEPEDIAGSYGKAKR